MSLTLKNTCAVNLTAPRSHIKRPTRWLRFCNVKFDLPSAGSGNAFETPGARKGSPSEHHWQFGSPYPLGQEEQWRLQQQQQSLATVTASTSNNVDGNVNDHNSMDEDNDTQSSPISLCDTRKAGRNTTTTAALDAPAAMDLPLRSRIRFEMAPKIPVPRGISSLPGQVDYRALRDFVAGSDREVSERSQTMARRRGSFHRNAERGSPGANGKSQSDRLVDRDEDGGSVPHRVRSGFDSENNVGVRSKGGVFARAPAAAAKAADDAAKEAAQAREDAMERWRKATLYWAHPASPLPQEALAAQKAAHAQVAKNPAHATRAQGGAHPGGSAASGYVPTSARVSRSRVSVTALTVEKVPRVCCCRTCYLETMATITRGGLRMIAAP